MEKISTAVSIVSEILVIVGIWKILRKCGQKGWYSIVPGLRYYKLGVCCGKKLDGMNCLFLEIAVYVLSPFCRFEKIRTVGQMVLVVALLTAGLAQIVFEIRVVLGLLRTFGLRRRWIFLWVFLPWVAAPLIGLGRKYQPVHLGAFKEEGLRGGQVPADLSAPVVRVEDRDGLVVHIADRKVRDFISERYLLKDIHLSIPGGSLVLLLGGSGAGKTTLVNAVTGYEKANATILLDGVDVYKHYGMMKHRIAFVPQQDLLRMNDTVIRTLDDAADMKLPTQISDSEKRKKIQAVMEVLGLTAGAEGLIVKKSGGQKKRISIGTELISDPDLFILDEPDSGLDGVIARELFEKLRMVAADRKIVIVITHTPDRVIELFDKVIVLAKDSGKVGRLAFYGSPDEAKAFFGQDSMEDIVRVVNGRDEGGDGRADEFIEKYARMTAERRPADE